MAQECTPEVTSRTTNFLTALREARTIELYEHMFTCSSFMCDMLSLLEKLIYWRKTDGFFSSALMIFFNDSSFHFIKLYL